jgi:hypothetical protein
MTAPEAERETAPGGSRSDPAAGFGAYRLEPVYLRPSHSQRASAIRLWLDQGVLRGRVAAIRRAEQLVYLVYRADGALAGMSTAGLRTGAKGRLWYVYRMFLRPEDRVPYLMRAVTNATRDLLRGFPHPGGPVAGMLIETENRKLMRPGIRRYFERHGYVYRGRSRRGLDLWLAPFDQNGEA